MYNLNGENVNDNPNVFPGMNLPEIQTQTTMLR